MEAASVEGARITLVLSLDELRLLNNALNEVANGLAFTDTEFSTRLGVERDEARSLLSAVHCVLDAAEQVGPPHRDRRA
jgi:hypothetical protein